MVRGFLLVKDLAKKPRFSLFSFKRKPKPLPKNRLPRVRPKKVPGPKSLKLTESLKRFECPQITFITDPFPIFFKKAQGINITDVDGNRYIDLAGAFGVAGVGHSSRSVIEAIKEQSKLMIHGMGDVHPNETKVLLAKRLSEITPGNLNQTIFSSTGSEAVETALKTAAIHTKKPGVIAFTGGYHGLGYGSLCVTHREDFKKPFEKQLGKFVHFAPFPDPRLYENRASEVSLSAIQTILKKYRRGSNAVGAIIIEPIQGRGGMIVPPPNFLKELRRLCDEEKILLIADEIFTGFGRTGSWFAVDKDQVVPDILCVGKGMGGGFPISACIGTTRVMWSWGTSKGEALHTSTFLGNPLGCAAALAVIQDMEDYQLVNRSKTMGDLFRRELYNLKIKYPIISDVRGAGLMIGMEFGEIKSTTAKKPRQIIPATGKTKTFVKEALRKGIIVLPGGPEGNVISIIPSFLISEKEIKWCISIFDKILENL